MIEHKLTEIWIYPVKSLGGIRLDTAHVRRKGLDFDRRWMLIDEGGVAMTQRDYPLMALFKPRIDVSQIVVDYVKNGATVSSVSFPIRDDSGPAMTARVWGDDVSVVEVNTESGKWFSDHLGIRCRLVRFPEDHPRKVNPDYAIGDDHVSLADAYPFLIIGESSLADLNTKLGEPVPMNRFRPNFVFSGGVPFVEDGWARFRIGKIPFAGVKKSDRCVLTTVDQTTAIRGAEPLRTLSTFRKQGNKVYFGQNLIALSEGIVSVGDVIIPDEILAR